MQNRRDQVQAHMFVMGRLTSGLLRTDLDAPESPVGRTNRGLAIGIVVSLLIAAGAFVWGLISPSTSDSWRVEGTLIVDEDTGARYFYDGGELRPVLNYASARLLAGASRSGLTSQTVGTDALRGTPRGFPVGIDGAPDVLPAPEAVADARPWLVCSAPADGPGTRDTVLSVAADAEQRPLPRGSAVLVADPSGARHLVWQGTRLRIDSRSSALESLGYGTAQPRTVSAAFINALPAGPDLTPVAPAGLGKRGPTFGTLSTLVGQVFRTSVPGADRSQHYLLREEGLVPLTNTQAALQLSDPETTRKAYEGESAVVRELDAGTLKGHLAPGGGGFVADAAGRMPESPPRLADVAAQDAVCSSVTPGSPSGPGVQVGVALVGQEALGPAVKRSATGITEACQAVDAVVVPPGGGALVDAGSATGGDVGGSRYLVADTGVKYRVPADEDVSALGYGDGQARIVPSLLLAMLPTGPDLGATAAATHDAPRTPAPSCGTAKANAERPSVSGRSAE
ncbi:type VII secretion protein EccB [Streptomyces sp. CHD11]|uniref:type VII secretion protein EccB n=1 Tax=Streptomyces sp. CHD11 TaxID=2741325 RepID=UPI001BFCA278|nr:type VII secretion protein EccB [Streptomyces sp. CHD11]MBT3149326.1 type VII secretion protein EccB [Streptomyces sp. CHD11]